MSLTEFYEDEFKRICREDGYEEGREDGLEEGLRAGRESGLREGLETGREEGERNKAISAAINLLKMNVLTPEQIAQAQGLAVEEVLELQKQISQPVC